MESKEARLILSETNSERPGTEKGQNREKYRLLN